MLGLTLNHVSKRGPSQKCFIYDQHTSDSVTPGGFVTPWWIYLVYQYVLLEEQVRAIDHPSYHFLTLFHTYTSG